MNNADKRRLARLRKADKGQRMLTYDELVSHNAAILESLDGAFDQRDVSNALLHKLCSQASPYDLARGSVT